ncbi:hypothetical protein LUZ61_010087 [Rhynchospora tenuis]|uniref:Cytochrome P450 n=1 Tax=Rhynchospora tenuis TaxID=198213 RepID=A0AAD5ZYE7_9POAL|nr:hypothetical protein LUZ61_010087 [Rhynchospora tenuis]
MGINWFIKMLDLLRSNPEIPLLLSTIIIFHLYFAKRNGVIPVNWPIVGMFPSIVAHLHNSHERIVQVLAASGFTFVFRGPWFTGMDILCSCDPRNVNYVFNTHEQLYPKGHDLINILGALGDCALTTEGERWRWHRKTLLRVLSSCDFQKCMTQAIRNKVESRLIPMLENFSNENMVIDLQDVFSRLMLDSICTALIGVDPGCLDFNFPEIPFAQATNVIVQSSFYLHIVPKYIRRIMFKLNVGYFRKIAKAAKVMEQFIFQKFEEKKVFLINQGNHETATNEPSDSDVLSTLIYEKRTSCNDFTELLEVLKLNMRNVIIGAVDANAASLVWFFWVLSKHPTVENKILEELKKNWPDGLKHDTLFDKKGVQNLVYLHAAVCECLRLYPPIPFEVKTASQADVLPSGHRVSPEMSLIFHTYSMARMEGIWGKDCAQFKPERWINEKGENRTEPAYKFFTFNCGPRTCLGKESSLSSLKMVIAVILYNYHVKVDEGHVAKPKHGIVLLMKHGLMVQIWKRE